MAWTQDDLDALNEAIATGALRVRMQDRDIQYRSLADLLAIRKMLEEQLGLAPDRGDRIRVWNPRTSHGL